MDPILLSSLIENGLKVAVSVSQLAVQSGAMTAEQVDALWKQQREDWSADWAEWLARQAGAPR